MDKPPVIPGAESFFFEGGRTGCLLIHGFLATPQQMRELGGYLSENRITVRCQRLPGHGTSMEDAVCYRWQDWYAAARDAYFDLREKCEKVIVGGLSMGGALALHLAAHYPVDAVISLAPVLKPKDKRYIYVPLVRRFKKYTPYSGPDIRDPAARRTAIGYPRTPLVCVEELILFLRHLRYDINDIAAPLLMMHSVHDHRVSIENMDIIYRTVRSEIKKKIVLEKSFHVLTVDVEKERVKKEILKFIQELKLV